MRAITRTLCACIAIGSSAWLVAQEDESNGEFAIAIDPATLGDRNPALGAAWLLYATAIVAEAGSPKFRDRPIDDYPIEVRARTDLARHWSSEERLRRRARDPYLDKLVEIRDAGFIEEYVVAVHAKPGWSLSAPELAALDLAAFFEWADDNLAEFRPVTLASVEDKTGRRSAPTGTELPDPEGFAPSRAGCAASVESMSGALELWEQQSGALRGTPVAADERGQFVAVLASVQHQEPYRTEGVSWVSMRPARWAFAAGFCGVEVGDLATARRWIERASGMLPLALNVRHELIHVLVMEGRLDEADAEVEELLAIDADDCSLARAWRRRGYIRFEQRRWDEARAAYLRSLEHDPGNKLALDELDLIDRQTRPRDEPLPSFAPQQLVSRCQGE